MSMRISQQQPQAQLGQPRSTGISTGINQALTLLTPHTGKPLPTLMQCGRHSSSSSSYGTIQSPHKFPPQSTHLTITAAQLQDAGAALAKRASAWQDALEQQRKGEQQVRG